MKKRRGSIFLCLGLKDVYEIDKKIKINFPYKNIKNSTFFSQN